MHRGLPVGEGTQDRTAAIRLHRTMGRQNRQVQRRLGAVAGKGMTDALQISPTTRSKARSTARSEEHTSELQSLMRSSYAVFCLKKKKRLTKRHQRPTETRQPHTKQ